MNENDGRAIIEDGAIVIRLPLDNLALVLDGAWAANNWSTRYKITNLTEFANDLVLELNSESENGTTAIHKMFDAAIVEAIDQGSAGIDEHEQQEM